MPKRKKIPRSDRSRKRRPLADERRIRSGPLSRCPSCDLDLEGERREETKECPRCNYDLTLM